MASTLSETFLLNLISNNKVDKYIKPCLYVWHKYTSALLIFIVTVSSLQLVIESDAITCMPVKNCTRSNDTLCRNNQSILYLSKNLSTSEKAFIDARCRQEHVHVLTKYLPLLMFSLAVVVIVLPTLLRTMIPRYKRMVEEFLSLVKECDESSGVFIFIWRYITELNKKDSSPNTESGPNTVNNGSHVSTTIETEEEQPTTSSGSPNTDRIPTAWATVEEIIVEIEPNEQPTTTAEAPSTVEEIGEIKPNGQPTTTAEAPSTVEESSSNNQCDKYVEHFINNKIIMPSNKDTGETEKKKFFALIDKASDYRKKYQERVCFGTLQLIIVILCVVFGVIFILIIVHYKEDLGLLPKFSCSSEDLVEGLHITSDYFSCFDEKAKHREVAFGIFAFVLVLKSSLDVIMEFIVICVGKCSKDEDTVATKSVATKSPSGSADTNKVSDKKGRYTGIERPESGDEGAESGDKEKTDSVTRPSSCIKFSCCTSGKLMKNLFVKMNVEKSSDIVYFMSRLNIYDSTLCNKMMIIMHPYLEEYGNDDLKAYLLSSADEASQSRQKKKYNEKFMKTLTHTDKFFKDMVQLLDEKTDTTFKGIQAVG